MGRPYKYDSKEDRENAIKLQKKNWYKNNKDKIKIYETNKEKRDIKKFSGYYKIKLNEDDEPEMRFSLNITERCRHIKKKHPDMKYRILYFCNIKNDETYKIAEECLNNSVSF